MLHHTNFVTEASSADVSPPSDYIDDEIIRILLDNDDEDLTEHLKVPEVREEPTPQSESCVNKHVPVTSACEWRWPSKELYLHQLLLLSYFD